MAVDAAAALIGGATPFGWAGMAASLLGGAAQTAPAGPSAANAIFGSSMFSNDASGWLVNFGDGAEQNQTNGPKTAPVLTATPTMSNPNSYIAPANNPTGYTSASAPALSLGANIPTSYLMIAGGALVLLIVLKKRG